MSASDGESLGPNSVFDLLSNRRRRMVLYYLRQNSGPIGVKELAAEVAAIENDVSVDELTSKQRKRVYVSLYQTHLPRLAELDIIEYDKDSGIVQLSDKNEIDRYLTTGKQSTYPWFYHNLVLAAGAGVLLILTLLNVPPLGLQIGWVIGMILIVFTVSLTIQAWHIRNRTEEIPPELGRHD